MLHRISFFGVFFPRIPPFIQYYWNLVCRTNKNCRIQISNYFNSIPDRKFCFTRQNAWLQNQQLFTLWSDCKKKNVLFNFYHILFLTSTVPLKFTKEFCEGFKSTLEYLTLPNSVFPIYMQGFSERWLKTIILMLYDLSNVDIVLSGLKYSIILFLLI